MSYKLAGVIWNDDGTMATMSTKELTPLEIINIKLKDKNNKYDRRVVNCNDEYLYLIKEEELAIIETELKALETIVKYTYSGGWSGDYTTRYWDMKNSEIEVIEKVFKNVPIHALSDDKEIY